MARKVRVRRDGARWVREDKLRQAEVAFITDKQRNPPEYWWDKLCQDVLPLSEFIKRARLARWATRREGYWNEVTQEILRQSKYRAVHDRVAELGEIQQIRADTLEAVKPIVTDGVKWYPVKPGSMEGMLGAFVKLDQLADNKRDAVLTMIEPELQRDALQGSSTIFTPDEMRSVARMLLEQRREQQTHMLQEGDHDDKDEDDDD